MQVLELHLGHEEGLSAVFSLGTGPQLRCWPDGAAGDVLLILNSVYLDSGLYSLSTVLSVSCKVIHLNVRLILVPRT